MGKAGSGSERNEAQRGMLVDGGPSQGVKARRGRAGSERCVEVACGNVCGPQLTSTWLCRPRSEG